MIIEYIKELCQKSCKSAIIGLKFIQKEESNFPALNKNYETRKYACVKSFFFVHNLAMRWKICEDLNITHKFSYNICLSLDNKRFFYNSV